MTSNHISLIGISVSRSAFENGNLEIAAEGNWVGLGVGSCGTGDRGFVDEEGPRLIRSRK